MSGSLTVRAKHGGPASDAAALQRGPAFKTRLAGTAVHAKGVLEGSGVAPRGTIIADGTAAGVDGFEQHFPQRGVKPFQAVGRHKLGVGPDARANRLSSA